MERQHHGTSGSFDLIIDATGSEVGIKYDVDFKNETNKPSNLKFKYNDGTTEHKFDQIEDLEQYFTDTINADDNNKTRTLTIDWVWDYETKDNGETLDENDKIDTNEGLNALDYSFDVIVTGTQVIPQSQYEKNFSVCNFINSFNNFLIFRNEF